MFLNDLKYFLEKIDHYRDEFLFLFIKPFWPRKISPNQISYLRILIGIALLILLFFFDIGNKVLIISLFCVGAISDLFDGSVARGLNKITEFGIMLDPIADRVLVLPIAIYALYKYQPWIFLVIILLEVVGALITMFQKTKEPNVKPNIFGKTKMVFWSVVFVIILVVWPQSPPIFSIDLLWISVVFAILSIFSRILELKNKGYVKLKNI